jgi:cation diffusion facilitator family transporter
LTSLGVLFGAVVVWLGYPIADPIVGLLIVIIILRIVWELGKAVLTRLVDGVDPEVVDEISQAAKHVQGVDNVTDVRVRWSGHRLYAEVNFAVSGEMSVTEAHVITLEARHQLLHHLPYLENVVVHVDPENLSGEEHHRIMEHMHEGSDTHSHP